MAQVIWPIHVALEDETDDLKEFIRAAHSALCHTVHLPIPQGHAHSALPPTHLSPYHLPPQEFISNTKRDIDYIIGNITNVRAADQDLR